MARCFPSRCQPKKYISVRVELSFCEGMVVSYVDETGQEFRGALMSHETRAPALTGEVSNDNRSVIDHDHNYSKRSSLKCDDPLATRRKKTITPIPSSEPNYYMNSGIKSREIKSIPPHPMENASHCFVAVCKAPDQVLPYVPSHTRRAKLNALRVIETNHRKGHTKKEVMLNCKRRPKKPCNPKIQAVKMKPFSINIPKISIGTERDFTQDIPTNVSLNSDSEVETINSMIQDPAQQTEKELMDSNTSTAFVITRIEPRALFTDKLEESQEKDMPSCSSEMLEQEKDSAAQTEEMELVSSRSCIETPMILAEENKEPVTENLPSMIDTERTNEQNLNDSTSSNILETSAGAETSTIDDARPPEGASQQEMGILTHLITDIRNEASSNPICNETVN
ncbi:PREDICTED: uncharacterized protein LOC109593767 [Amphimedon queenslandica]|uniref:Uncharacterized protein n=1 Tax=Amphimedon queenslandica TaxID=400682 RepID=A0A1X7VK31_AMPQE|nr:PREDICTED: uncharacterized protein LOC109593767 [Amphimedon queenslandica]|eukprot:XP_019864401.1 PREDICTED: uncharacterized protein LOC109593767 [Amphimedon queenslandica]